MKEAYFKAVEQVALPKKKPARILLFQHHEACKGTAYGGWFLRKINRKGETQPFRVAHIQSGLGVGGFATRELAERYIKAMIHADMPTDWDNKLELGDINFKKALQIFRAHCQEKAPAPEYFTTPRSRCRTATRNLWSQL